MYMYLSLTEHVLVHVHNNGIIIIQYIEKFLNFVVVFLFANFEIYMYSFLE